MRVNAIAPGTVAWPADLDAGARAAILARIPLGRAGDASDVGRAAAFLAREPFLTGVVLPVDGGASLV